MNDDNELGTAALIDSLPSTQGRDAPWALSQIGAVLFGDLDELLADPFTAPWTEAYEDIFPTKEVAFRMGALGFKTSDELYAWRQDVFEREQRLLEQLYGDGEAVSSSDKPLGEVSHSEESGS